MKRALRLRTAVLLLCGLSNSATAQDARQALGTTSAHAYIGHRDALFVFSVPDQPSWTWHQPDTRVGTLEYGWSVTVGDRPVFQLGFSLFKPGGAAVPSSGPLGEMLEAGQLTLWKADSTGAALLAQPPVDLQVIGLNGQILLHLDDQDVVEMLFGSRPDEVAVTHTIDGIRTVGSAAVQYTNSEVKLWSRPASDESLDIGAPAPPFDLEVLAAPATGNRGTRMSLEHLKDEVVVLYFWTSHCPVSVEEFDAAMQHAQQWTQRGVAVLGMIIRDDRREASSFLASRANVPIPHLLANSATEKAYAAWGTPYVVLIDREGRVAYRAMSAGQWTPGSVLSRKLERLLTEQTGSAPDSLL